MPVDVGGIKIGGDNIIRDKLYRHYSALDINSHANGSTTIQDISGNNEDGTAQDVAWNNYYWQFGDSGTSQIDFPNVSLGLPNANWTWETWVYPTDLTGKGSIIMLGNFDDTSQIDFPNVSLGLPNANWTWETWVYPTDLTGKGSIIMLGNFDDSAGFERGDTTNTIRAGFRTDGSGEDVAVITSSTLSINNWYHLAIRLDDSANEVEFFVNMVSQGTATMDSGDFSEGGTIRAGATRVLAGSSGTERYKGGIAVFRIYNAALTEDELLYNFNADRGAFGI